MDKKIIDMLMEDLDQSRLEHTLRVVEEAKRLARRYDVDIQKATTAALLHDCGKLKDNNNLLKLADDFDIMMTDNKDLIHAPLGAALAQHKYKIEDEDILNAIKYHTTGRKDMSHLEKIIYIADYIEPNRKFIGVERVRRLAFQDLDESICLAMDQTIVFLVKSNRIISLDTIEARNQLVSKGNKGGSQWAK